MTNRIASCSCGKLTVSTRGDPIRVSICHCLACQRRTGSVFGAQARFLDDAVTIEGPSTEYVRLGDEGSSARFHFCPEWAPLSSTGWTLSPAWWLFPSAPLLTPIFRNRACRSTGFGSTLGSVLRTALSNLIEWPVARLMAPDHSFRSSPLRNLGQSRLSWAR